MIREDHDDNKREDERRDENKRTKKTNIQEENEEKTGNKYTDYLWNGNIES